MTHGVPGAIRYVRVHHNQKPHGDARSAVPSYDACCPAPGRSSAATAVVCGYLPLQCVLHALQLARSQPDESPEKRTWSSSSQVTCFRRQRWSVFRLKRGTLCFTVQTAVPLASGVSHQPSIHQNISLGTKNVHLRRNSFGTSSTFF